MTTFTTQDREDAEGWAPREIKEYAPDGTLIRHVVQQEPGAEPIPFAGWIQHSDDTVTRAKSLVEQAPYQPGYEDAVPQMEKLRAELVAWRYKYEDGDTSWNYQDNKSLMKSMIRVHHIIAEPLYTNLANLTDDAQYDRGFDAGCKHTEKNLQAEIDEYKKLIAILRKAQEK